MYITHMKNIKNCKLFSEAEQEFEKTQKRRKESLCQFDTLFRIDLMIEDAFMEEVELPRVEKNLSSHTKIALWPKAISRFGHFITVQVENCYGTARVIPFVVLYCGYGTGSMKNSSVCSKKHKCYEGRVLKKMPEWHLQKIDLNELKNIEQMGVRYQTPQEELELDEDNNMQIKGTKENLVLQIEDEEDIFRRQYLRLKHYEDGNLINVIMGKYRVVEGERNITLVKDTMCLRKATKKDEIAEEKVEDMGDMLALFECQKCGKKFEVLSSLAIHRKTREEAAEDEMKGEEGIKCLLCGKMYNALKGARIHREMECDRGKPTNMCLYCGEYFFLPTVCDWHVKYECKLTQERRQKEKKEKEREKEEQKIKEARKAAKEAEEEAEKKAKEQENKEKEEAEKKMKEQEDKEKEEAEKKAKEQEDKEKEEAEKKAREGVESAKEAAKKHQERQERRRKRQREKGGGRKGRERGKGGGRKGKRGGRKGREREKGGSRKGKRGSRKGKRGSRKGRKREKGGDGKGRERGKGGGGKGKRGSGKGREREKGGSRKGKRGRGKEAEEREKGGSRKGRERGKGGGRKGKRGGGKGREREKGGGGKGKRGSRKGRERGKGGSREREKRGGK